MVIPSTYTPLNNELLNFALEYHNARKVETSELPHERAVQIERLEESIVRIATYLKLEGALQVRDPLDRVVKAVRVIERWMRVFRINDAVRDRVAHIRVVVL